MRRRYEKPAMNVERFQPNVAVAACDREWDGTVDTSWPAQDLACLRNTGTVDTIFGSQTSGCKYTTFSMIYISVPGTYTQSQLKNMNLTINVDPKHGSSVTIPEGGGYVLSWENGNHYGVPTPEIIKHMISSF